MTCDQGMFRVVAKTIQILFLSLGFEAFGSVFVDLIGFMFFSIFSEHNCFVIIITTHKLLFSQ